MLFYLNFFFQISREIPLTDIIIVKLADPLRTHPLTERQGSTPSRPAAQQAAAPREAATATARAAFRTAPGGRRKRAGPTHASMATVAVRVNRMDTAVLMATIWPNLAKGTMTQKKSGTVEMTVVTALDRMATPTWSTASRLRRCLSAPASWRGEALTKTTILSEFWQIRTYVK